MKKMFAIVLSISIVLIMLMPLTASAAEVGQYSIVLPENASETEKYSAILLTEKLSDITDKKVSVSLENEQTDGFVFYLGATSKADITVLNGKPDGYYVIDPVDNGCAIYGAGNRGTVYGVYGYLEDYCGFHCFTAESGFVTESTEIIIPEERNEYTPAFEYTETDWHSPRDTVYSVANGLSGGNYRDIPSEMGGGVNYISGFCHTMTTQFCSADTYFGEHPEYFALHDGKRNPQQLCLTNEDVYNLVLSEVMDLLKEKHDPNANLQIISLTQNDSGEDGAFCECDACKAIDDENGAHSGTMITFVNRIAKAVSEAGYDNVTIDTFAYRYTRTAPSKVVPEDNVIVRFCTIECCFTHSIDDENCPCNIDLKNDIINWNKICDRLYVWDYTTNYAYTLGIFPDFNVIQDNMCFFAENGVKGVYEEGAYYVDAVNTEFGELRAYLLSRLMRDPQCDIDAEMNAFCKAFYGEGGENIAEFVKKISDNAAEKHSEIYSAMSEVFTLTEEDAEYYDGLFEKAKSAAEGNENALANIVRSELSWRFVKSSLLLGEFSSLTSRIKENKQLYADILAAGTTQFSESGSDTDVIYLYSLLPAEGWTSGGNVLSEILYKVAFVITVTACLVALIYIIVEIKNRRYSALSIVPISAALFYVIFWNRRAYLAWKDIDQYAISAVLLLALTGAIIYIELASQKDTNRKKIVFTLIHTVAFVAIYWAPLLVINNVLNEGRANVLAISAMFVIYSLAMLIVNIAGLKKAKSRNKSDK